MTSTSGRRGRLSRRIPIRSDPHHGRGLQPRGSLLLRCCRDQAEGQQLRAHLPQDEEYLSHCKNFLSLICLL